MIWTYTTVHSVNTERNKLTCHITDVFSLMQSLENTDLVDVQTKNTAGLHEGGAVVVNGKRHREQRQRGIYASGTAVCATQMGVNFR